MKKVLFLVLMGILGCGSNPSNDQGISFSLVGFCADSACTEELAGATIPLDGNNGAAGTIAYGELRNYLLQRIRIKGALVEYSVIGGNIPTHYDTLAVGAIMDAATGDAAGGAGGGETAAATTKAFYKVSTPSELTLPFPLLSPNFKKLLELSRNDLPDTPFSIITTVRFTGITSSGDEYTTNPLDFTMYISAEPDPAIVNELGGDAAGQATTGDASTDTSTSTGDASTDTSTVATTNETSTSATSTSTTDETIVDTSTIAD